MENFAEKEDTGKKGRELREGGKKGISRPERDKAEGEGRVFHYAWKEGEKKDAASSLSLSPLQRTSQYSSLVGPAERK